MRLLTNFTMFAPMRRPSRMASTIVAKLGIEGAKKEGREE
jgi:hypothetical protein